MKEPGKNLSALNSASKIFKNNFISVPWKNKEEWLIVYRKAFSSHLNDQVESYNTMLKWQYRSSYSSLPLGVKCTCMLLQGVIKDKIFHPEVQNGLTDEELVLIYGAAIMRFLNYLGTKDIVRASGDPNFFHESFYGKAKKIGIPDWIVNVRHQFSHGVVLPKPDLLRICVTFLLRFLKEIYWEKDDVRLHDVVLKRPRKETLEEYFMKLLNVYVLLKEQVKIGYQNCNSIEDDLIRNEISNIEKYRLVSEQLDNAPWEVNYLVKRRRGLTEDEIMVFRLKDISLKSVKYIKEYTVVNEIDICKIITSRILEDSIKHQCVRLDIWGNLIKILSDHGYATKFLDIFVDYVFKNTTDVDKSLWARKWLIVLLQALLKRSRVEKLKIILKGKQKTKDLWERRLISSLSSQEIKNLKEMLARSRYDFSKKLALEIHKSVTEIVERYDRRLRSTLRFNCDPLNPPAIQEYIIQVCKEPNDFTRIAFDFFADMLLNPSLKIRKSIQNLIDIYQGTCKLEQNTSNVVHTLPMMLKQLDLPEDRYLECLSDGNQSQKNTDQEAGSSQMMENDSTEPIYDVEVLPERSTFDSSWPSFLKLPWSDK